jgi:hypothetical protein
VKTGPQLPWPELSQCMQTQRKWCILLDHVWMLVKCSTALGTWLSQLLKRWSLPANNLENTKHGHWVGRQVSLGKFTNHTTFTIATIFNNIPHVFTVRAITSHIGNSETKDIQGNFVNLTKALLGKM